MAWLLDQSCAGKEVAAAPSTRRLFCSCTNATIRSRSKDAVAIALCTFSGSQSPHLIRSSASLRASPRSRATCGAERPSDQPRVWRQAEQGAAVDLLVG